MNTQADTREWLTPKELAHELRLHPSSIYRAIERGQLRALRLNDNGSLRIRRSQLERLTTKRDT